MKPASRRETLMVCTYRNLHFNLPLVRVPCLGECVFVCVYLCVCVSVRTRARIVPYKYMYRSTTYVVYMGTRMHKFAGNGKQVGG